MKTVLNLPLAQHKQRKLKESQAMAKHSRNLNRLQPSIICCIALREAKTSKNGLKRYKTTGSGHVFTKICEIRAYLYAAQTIIEIE